MDNREPEFLRLWQLYFKLSLMLQSQATHLLWNGKPFDQSRTPAYGVSSLHSAVHIWLSTAQAHTAVGYPDEHSNTDIFLYTREVVSFRANKE